VTPTEKRRFIELCQRIAVVERDSDTYHRLCKELDALLNVKNQRLTNEHVTKENRTSQS
jgi:hypothetical protein